MTCKNFKFLLIYVIYMSNIDNNITTFITQFKNFSSYLISVIKMASDWLQYLTFEMIRFDFPHVRNWISLFKITQPLSFKQDSYNKIILSSINIDRKISFKIFVAVDGSVDGDENFKRNFSININTW